MTCSRLSSSSVPNPSSTNRVCRSKPAGLLAHGVGQAQRQGQRGHEGLAAGQGRGLAAARSKRRRPAGPGRCGLRAGPARRSGQLVATLAHHLQPLVGQAGDLLEPRRQEVGRQPHPQGVVGAGARHAVGQLLHDGLLGLGRPDRGRRWRGPRRASSWMRRSADSAMVWARRDWVAASRAATAARPARRGRARAAARRQRPRAGPAAPRPGRAGCRGRAAGRSCGPSSAVGQHGGARGRRVSEPVLAQRRGRAVPASWRRPAGGVPARRRVGQAAQRRGWRHGGWPRRRGGRRRRRPAGVAAPSGTPRPWWLPCRPLHGQRAACSRRPWARDWAARAAWPRRRLGA